MEKKTRKLIVKSVLLIIFFVLLFILNYNFLYYRNMALKQEGELDELKGENNKPVIARVSDPSLEYYLNNVLKIAKDIASQPYECKDFCWEKSTRLYNELKDDYNVKIVYGRLNNRSHAWVEVTIPIEVTTGNIISHDSYNEKYAFGYYGVPRAYQTKC